MLTEQGLRLEEEYAIMRYQIKEGSLCVAYYPIKNILIGGKNELRNKKNT